jgi:hypothetical protein
LGFRKFIEKGKHQVRAATSMEVRKGEKIGDSNPYPVRQMKKAFQKHQLYEEASVPVPPLQTQS